jgi:Nucleosome binding factor SPN, SPT16 subunit
MKINAKIVTKGRLLAQAYIAGKSGQAEEAGRLMCLACEGQELDPVMHGVAESLGFSEDDADDDMDTDMLDTDQDELDSADDDADDDMDTDTDTDPDDDDTDPDDTNTDPDDDGGTMTSKVMVPASVARLANTKW